MKVSNSALTALACLLATAQTASADGHLTPKEVSESVDEDLPPAFQEMDSMDVPAELLPAVDDDATVVDETVPEEEELSEETEEPSEAAMETEMPSAEETTGDGTMDAIQLYEKALAAVGGADAFNNLKNLQIMAEGDTWIEYESTTPDEITPGGSYERNYTLAFADDGLFRVDELYTPLFEAFVFLPPQRVTRIIHGDIGEQIGDKLFGPAGTLNSLFVGSFIRQQLLFNPHFMLSLIFDPNEINYLGEDENGNGILEIPDPDEVWPIRLYIDPTTGYIVKLTTRENHVLVRDRRITIRYQDWSTADSMDGDGDADDDILEAEILMALNATFTNATTVNATIMGREGHTAAGSAGMPFPKRIRVSNEDGQLIWDERRTAIMMPEELSEDTFALSDDVDMDSYDEDAWDYGTRTSFLFEGFSEIGFSYPFLTSTGDVQQLTERINLIYAGANTLLVEHDGGMIVIEAPGSEVEGQSLLDQVEDIAPGASITHVFSSHHHVDHSGGIRQLMTTNATLVVGDGVVDFWEETLAAGSEIVPDDLSMLDATGFDIVSIPFEGQTTFIDTDDLVVIAYHSPQEHASDWIMVSIETEGTLYVYQADTFNGGFGGTVALDGPPGFFDVLRDLSILTADCTSEMPLVIVSAHGTPLTLEESLAELASLGVDVGCESL